MKKLLSTFALFSFLCTISWSQEGVDHKCLITMNTPLANQAATVMPGAISFVSVNSDDETTNLLTLGGGVAYRIVNNFYGGLNIGYGRESADEYSATTYLVGPQARYYFPSGSKTSLFLGANAAFGKLSVEFDGQNEEDINLSSFGGALGVAYSLGSRVDFEAQLTYDTASAKDEDDDESDASLLGIRIGFAIRL